MNSLVNTTRKAAQTAAKAQARVLSSAADAAAAPPAAGGSDDLTDEWFDKPTYMSNSEAFVETMRAHGITDCFGIVGSAFMDSLDIFEPAGIRFISVQHEQNATHMADGYARVTDRHGVCCAQNGPGISNFVTGMGAAYWAHSPVVAITPEGGTKTKGLGGFQELDQIPVFSAVTKYQADVNNPTRIPELTNRALDIALHERGPVQINIPRDHFYHDDTYKIPRPTKLEHGAGSETSLQEALALIKGAKNPVILAGGGVCMGNATEEVAALADFLGAPVATTYLHNDSFPCDHQLACGSLGYQGSRAAMNAMHEADLVLALGSRLSPFGTLPQYGFDYFPKDAKVVQVDIDARRLGLSVPVDVPIQGDCRKTAATLLERLRADGAALACEATRGERLARTQAFKDAWEAELNAMTVTAGEHDGLIKPRMALRELEKAMPDDAMVSTDIGNTCSVANSYLRFKQPKSFLGAMTFGNCGYAFPAAMGAKVGRPDRPAVSYAGDGAWGMSLNEVLTAVREEIPVTAVVFNNGQWGAEKKNQVLWYGDRYIGTNLPRVGDGFAAIARAMGAEGIRVDQADQVGPALKKAIDAQMNDGKTTVVEIMTTRELGDPFRRDAMKLPVRRLAKYQPFTETNESATGQPVDIQAGAVTSPH